MSASELVIGDGFIGNKLAQITGAIQTTRKLNYLDGRWPFDMLTFGPLPEVDIVYICAGVNGALTCARDPQTSFRVNVDGTVRVAEHYRCKAFVVWISSTTVEWQSDHYGSQKRITETILRTMPQVGIVRAGRVTKENVEDLCQTLTKVGRRKIQGITLWGEDEKPYAK